MSDDLAVRVRRFAARVGIPAILLACLCLVPFVAGEYTRFVCVLIFINIIAAVGVNISNGYCGLVSVGHAGFVAVGAYLAAFCLSHVSGNLCLALGAGVAAAGAMGIFIGLPTLHLSSLYIAMVTFGFGQAINLVAINWIDVTGGPNGLSVPPAAVLGSELSNIGIYFLTASCCAFSIWMSRNIAYSRLGRAFLAIKDSEIAAQSMGIHIPAYKMIAFGLSAMLGGLAGGLYAIAAGFVNPDAFVFQVSVLFVTMCVVGGLGTIAGPIVGATILTILPELLRPFAEYKELFSGVILLGFLVFVPTGVVPLLVRAGDLMSGLRRALIPTRSVL